MIALVVPFFITAILYAAVGFGGGSTYNALLVLAEIDYRILPSIALVCNLIVVSGGTYRFARAGHVDLKCVLPWIIASVPAAWLGGYMDISETMFVGLLGFSLFVAGMRMLWAKEYNQKLFIKQYRFVPLVFGSGLGLLAGMVGIGGGVFLAPILYLLHWDTPKKIAATCSIFILVNSAAGLVGQLAKLSDMEQAISIENYWMLFFAVFIGGQIGSYVGAKRLNPNILRFMTALLILYVAVRLIWSWWWLVT